MGHLEKDSPLEERSSAELMKAYVEADTKIKPVLLERALALLDTVEEFNRKNAKLGNFLPEVGNGVIWIKWHAWCGMDLLEDAEGFMTSLMQKFKQLPGVKVHRHLTEQSLDLYVSFDGEPD